MGKKEEEMQKTAAENVDCQERAHRKISNQR